MFLPATISPRIICRLLCGLFAALAATASAMNWNYLDGPLGGSVYGLVVAPNGDVYATNGLGVQRHAAGTTTWTAVDPAHILPGAVITIDSHGSLFALDAGRVVKLVNGSWVTAGDGQNGCADSLQVDASDTLWTACIPNLQLWVGATELKVQKLPSDASTWVSAGTVGGVSDGGVTNVTVDGAGTAYVGSSELGYLGSEGFGIYSLAPGATTWTQNNAGLGSLDVLVLQRDADGAVYAGTYDGVYKRVAGIWQKVGTGLDTYVTALVIDTNGDLYAGTYYTGAWRLAADTSTWTRILGLNGTVNTLALGGGRIYAGTGPIHGGSDAMGGSPSGVYILSMSDSLPPLALQVGLSGTWYDARSSGQGFMVQVHPDMTSPGRGVVVASWLTYDNVVGGAERQRWYTLSGPVVSGQTDVSMTIYQNTGGNFNAPPVTTAHPVGTAALSFDSCTNGQLTYRFTDGSGRASTILLTRLTPNVACGATPPDTTSAGIDFSGNWYDPATSGQGITMEFNPIAQMLFFAWYTYAPNGAGAGPAGQRWYTGQGSYVGDIGARTPVQVYETTGGLFDDGMATPTTVVVGNGVLVIDSCNTAKLSFTFTGGSSSGASGTIALSSIDANLSGRGCWDYD